MKNNMIKMITLLIIIAGNFKTNAQEIQPSIESVKILALKKISTSDTAGLRTQLALLARLKPKATEVFSFFEINKLQIDQLMGKEYSLRQQRAAIDIEYITPIVQLKATPQWKALKTTLEKKYGKAAEQPLLIGKVNYDNTHKAYKDLVVSTEELMKKYPEILSGFILNNFAFDIFKVETDPALLQKVLKWSEQSLKEAPNSPHYMDTYANLLHKLGQTKKAVVIEEKAYSLADDRQKKELLPFLEKMRAGQPTW